MAERLRVVVDVMPKPEILDPQGQAVAAALATLGFTGVRDVRAGKRFEVIVDADAGSTPEVLDQVREAASRLLANPVIEDYTVRLEPDQARGEPESATPALATPAREPDDQPGERA